jgi:hypothetical protein
MADGDVYKAVLEWRYSAIDVAVNNVFWFRQEGEESGVAGPETVLGFRLANAMPSGTSWPSLLRAWLSTGFAINNVRVQRVYPVVTGAFVVAVNVGGQASGGPTYVPSSAALVVRLRSTLNTRRGRGRVYLGGFGSVKTAGGTEYALANEGYWGANVRTAAATFVENLRTQALTTPNGGGVAVYRMGVWSKAIAGPHPPYDMAWSPVTSWEATSAIRVQRRREVGVGV